MKKFTFLILGLYFLLLQPTNGQVSVVFNRDCERTLIDNITKARSEIKVAIFSFTRFSIARALIKAKQSDIPVQVIIDSEQANTEYGDKIVKLLKNNKIEVFLLAKKDRSHMHHKFTIIDKKKVLTGSYNYSTNATKFNDENLLLIEDKTVVKSFLSEWQRLLK